MAVALPSETPMSGSQDDAEVTSPAASESQHAANSRQDASASEREDQAIVAHSSAISRTQTAAEDGDEAEKASRQGDADGNANAEREGKEAGEGDEEESGECGFCLFMKSGPCRGSFIEWEKCVEQAEKDKEDMVEKCHKITFLLKECMEQNSDYYEPVLQAERAMGEEAEAEATQATLPEGEEGSSPPDTSEQPSIAEQHTTESSDLGSP